MIRMSIGHHIDLVPAKTKDEEKIPIGTHQGRISDPDARARRRAKNARNQTRRGQAVRPQGSAKRSFRGRKAGTGVKSSGKR